MYSFPVVPANIRRHFYERAIELIEEGNESRICLAFDCIMFNYRDEDRNWAEVLHNKYYDPEFYRTTYMLEFYSELFPEFKLIQPDIEAEWSFFGTEERLFMLEFMYIMV